MSVFLLKWTLDNDPLIVICVWCRRRGIQIRWLCVEVYMRKSWPDVSLTLVTSHAGRGQIACAGLVMSMSWVCRWFKAIKRKRRPEVRQRSLLTSTHTNTWKVFRVCSMMWCYLIIIVYMFNSSVSCKGPIWINPYIYIFSFSFIIIAKNSFGSICVS